MSNVNVLTKIVEKLKVIDALLDDNQSLGMEINDGLKMAI